MNKELLTRTGRFAAVFVFFEMVAPAGAAASRPNLITNPELRAGPDGTPAGWTTWAPHGSVRWKAIQLTEVFQDVAQDMVRFTLGG